MRIGLHNYLSNENGLIDNWKRWQNVLRLALLDEQDERDMFILDKNIYICGYGNNNWMSGRD